MRFLKYLTPVWAAVLFYSFSSLFVGAMGINAYKQLNKQHEKQLANLQILQNKTEELQGIKEALLYDKDTIAVYARELGFGASDERFIRIMGLDYKHKENLDEGKVINISDIDFVENKTLHIISIVIAISMFVCIGVIDLINMIGGKVK
jgi:cell division protein FtsB